jgi:protein Mpv17
MVSTPKSPNAIIAKVAIDQLLFAPFCTLLFYAFKTITESRPGELVRELHDKFVPTMLAGYKLWPAAHVINFAFVPTSQRILFANVVSVAGTYILSRAAAGDYSAKRSNEVVFDSVQRID